MSIIFTLGVLFVLQITLFYFYRISTLVTGAIFTLIFGELSLGIIDYSAMPQYLLNASIFMILFYLGLTKPNGEFFKKYIWKYKKSFLTPTFITMLVVFSVAILMNFDLHIAIILVLSLGVVSLSTNSLAVNHFRDLSLQKSEVYKIFFAKALPNNIIIVVMFVTLLSLFDQGSTSFTAILTAVGKVLAFIVLSFAISRYIYPRISQRFKNVNIHLTLLFINALLQSYIATLLGLHFAIGVFLSTLLVPELFLKMNLLEPIRERVGNFNNYTAVPVLGMIIGLNIDINILFDYVLFIPFAVLTATILAVQYLSTSFALLFAPLKKWEREVVSIGTVAKTELSLIIILISVSYGIIDGDIFTSSIILMSFLNILTWHKLKSVDMESK